ncbi:plasmid stabilization protein [Frankia sp. CcI156]|uniref:Plasmid stabilization system n=1 Tax=Frankia casuarinae (strain DSM 45818 / CECT 9043 / HFP020203 / CcI3) TaxID=106370 RepID=Q2J9K1_FRACC|nr:MULTISPECIES: type II toxin-antitoxin system RelE/ParE family toxin [Frankia]ABD12041.1 plasmid stabilization system [Frankia casuarinae]ESZ99742.1 cytotoxic translational repressor of toxin-antitoxin stability system [Frankia sp. CcI6]EYT91702.1 cytotoxic translational repressor of toxin-antitoxin stability system [Frankia casuarinae]KDA40417.1 cytotoxic translational repressor of toxin-antitoxin stability system [Frankia sp. BMG5.23]KEZ34213.1 cytotoxic translational repressor of toxin-an
MTGAAGPYRLEITGPAARALAGRIPEKVATAVHEFITTTLLENPHRLGKRLLYPPYAGTWSARRGMYRVLYEIDEENRIVLVTAVEHRADAYRGR